MLECTTFVGLDAHVKTITAAMLLTSTGELKRATFGTTGRELKKLLRWLERESEGAPQVCYEAGPTGYLLQRFLHDAGVACEVVAPSLIWRQPGQRRKNDRRDALKLAQQLAAGMLTAVHPPTAEQEADRSLIRCREDARKALHQVRQQLLKFLQLRGVRHEGRTWTKAHRKWLNGLRLAEPSGQLVLDDYLLALEQATVRLERLDQQIAALAETPQYREVVGRLCCFRGVATLTAMVFVTELHSFGRFPTARSLMGYLGLVPGEHSSGEQEQDTGLTRTGNSLARRLLVEAATHYRAPAKLSEALQQRQAGQPPETVALAQKAMVRLNQRYWRLVNRGKPPQQAKCAVARELVGFLWAALQPQVAAEQAA